MTNNAYIHIPFCKSKCNYCSFVSFAALELKEKYLHSLHKEISFRYNNETLYTLYFGGGTPSILSITDFKTLLNHFKINEKTEVTAELNPENISKDYLQGLRNAGINRLSFGCQTFDDKILKQIGRRHSSEDVKTAVKKAQNAGFTNISLDFIYGLPDQTVEMFEQDLKEGVGLEISHISLYGLKIDEGCYFYNNPPQNLPDEDIQADMYLKAISLLENSGFEHYEISNFSKPGYNSRHNLNYWENNSYYGFGTGAHGYENCYRYFNPSTIGEYIENPIKHKGSSLLSKQEQLEEEIFLGFRKTKGIDNLKINNKFNIDFEKKYSTILKKFLDTNHLVKTDMGYALSDKGILVSNLILSEFLE